MLEHGIQIENVYFRLFHDVTRLNVPEKDVHFVGQTNINVLKVLHIHPYYEIFVSDDRPVVVDTRNGPYTAEPPDILIIPPGVEHAMISEKTKTRWPSLCFSFSKKNGGSQDLFGDLQKFLGKNEPILIKDLNDEPAQIIRIIELAGLDSSRYLASSLADLIIRLSGLQSGKNSQNAEAGVSRQTGEGIDVKLSKRIDDLVASRFMTDIRASEAAKLLHVSTRQLDRLMRKYIGTTFRQAIIRHRLKVAVELFETTDLTIERISSEVGFASRVPFTRAFTAQYGMPPGRYRRTHCAPVGKK